MSAPQAWLQPLRRLPQWLRFALVASAAAVVHLAVLGLLVAWAGMAPLAANAPAFLLGFAVSYNGHALLTFHRAQARGPRTPARFFVNACVDFGANEVLYAAALHWLHWHYLWSQAGILVWGAALTFVLCKFWVFKARPVQ